MNESARYIKIVEWSDKINVLWGVAQASSALVSRFSYERIDTI